MTPKITQHTIQIEIEKPIAGLFYIRDKWLKYAKEGRKIVLTYEKEKFVCSYKEWMKGAKRLEKVFLIKDQPMVLFGNYFMRYKKKEEAEEVSAIKNLAGMPPQYLNQIRAFFK